VERKPLSSCRLGRSYIGSFSSSGKILGGGCDDAVHRTVVLAGGGFVRADSRPSKEPHQMILSIERRLLTCSEAK
jgi:hypothetical protein